MGEMRAVLVGGLLSHKYCGNRPLGVQMVRITVALGLALSACGSEGGSGRRPAGNENMPRVR